MRLRVARKLLRKPRPVYRVLTLWRAFRRYRRWAHTHLWRAR